MEAPRMNYSIRTRNGGQRPGFSGVKDPSQNENYSPRRGTETAWSSKKQTVVADSTGLAELLAIPPVAKEAIAIQKIAIALGIGEEQPIPIYTDSESAIKNTAKGSYSQVTKCIDNRYLGIKDLYRKEVIKLIHIDGKMNPAVGLTKPLKNSELDAFRTMIRVMKMKND